MASFPSLRIARAALVSGIAATALAGCMGAGGNAPQLPSATFVQTKTASGNGSGVSLAPEAACAAIRAGMVQALRAVPARPELTLAAPLAVRLQTQTPALADLFSLWPTLEREAPDVIAFGAASVQDAVRTLNALSAMSATLR